MRSLIKQMVGEENNLDQWKTNVHGKFESKLYLSMKAQCVHQNTLMCMLVL